jgi:hypothetical protein
MRIILICLLSGCGCPGDNLRVVNPVTWHELDYPYLQEMCQSWDPKTRGCVISRADGDHIYTLPVKLQDAPR